MKFTLLLTFHLRSAFVSHTLSKHKLEGVIVDSVSQARSICGCWFVVGKPIDGTLTDEKVKFKFEEVKSGATRHVSFVDYKPMSMKTLKCRIKSGFGERQIDR
jgi:hypothetical protein